MLSAAVRRSKSYVYSLSSVRYQAAFSTAVTVRAFAFFSKPTVYPFWFFHLNRLFADDTQIADRTKRYVEDISPIAGLQITDVVWDELVAELRAPALQSCFTALCHHTFFNSGTEQERWTARGASLLEMRRLKAQAQRQGDLPLTAWLDQTIHTAEGDPMTCRAAMQVADVCATLSGQLSRFSPDQGLTVYWGLFTDGRRLQRGYVAYGKQLRWTYLGADPRTAQQSVVTANDWFRLGSSSP